MKYGIIEERTIHHEGDERSEWCPGYHAYDEKVTVFTEFASEAEMQEFVRDMLTDNYTHRPYRLVRFEELAVRIVVEVVPPK